MKNVLVTGGAGFIGSNFVHYMLENTDAFILGGKHQQDNAVLLYFQHSGCSLHHFADERFQ